MLIQNSPFVVPLIFSAIMCGALGVYSYKNLHIPGSRPFTLLMAGVTIWLIGSIFEYSLLDPAARYIAVVCEYPGIVLVPVAWLLFIITYTGRDAWIEGRRAWLLFIVPAIVEIFVLTNPLHQLYYTSISVDIIDGLTYPAYTHGPLFWIHTIYSYILILSGIGILAAELIYAKPIYRKQLLIIFIVCLIPFFFNVLYVSGLWSVKGIDFTPIVFFITAVGLFISSYFFQFLNLTPVAHSLLLKNLKDALIVVDNKDIIVDANPAALRHRRSGDISYLGESITKIFPFTKEVLEKNHGVSDSPGLPVELPVNGSPRFYEMECIPVINNSGIQIGKLVTLHDVHEQTVATRIIHKSNQKLQLLSGITRHDIKNQLSVLTGYLSLAEDIDGDEFKAEYLGKLKEATRMINEQIEFTSVYQNIGLQKPQWYELHALMEQVKTQIPGASVKFVNELDGARIFADPMLERALYNLFDNTMRYGKTAATIRSYYYLGDDSMRWIVEDDGIGVAPEDKNRIFNKGYGNNTGLGLFLVREILSITDCSITENGVPGGGARFEISVPHGQYNLWQSGR
ncbi:histidine kinase N-terminal 7TM domain-containing protein [uncultured Methanospirillum sp.]|uniref:histidine kinase N-terminal 7TM domain-containing protein n=1 Tax=uncultured Methanospirillum sp. TaxID=262503 RepID=UPI0029C7B6AD|nr:histidine kinase N-terminal 7TM domain-containing protein [uncultured Methanospirillum sp.]